MFDKILQPQNPDLPPKAKSSFSDRNDPSKIGSGDYAGEMKSTGSIRSSKYNNDGTGWKLDGKNDKFYAGKINLYNLNSLPTSADSIGQLCVVSGVLYICTNASIPTWTKVGTQS